MNIYSRFDVNRFAPALIGPALFAAMVMVGMAVAPSPKRAVILGGILVCLVVYLLSPPLMSSIALFYTFTTLPIGLPVGTIVGGYQMFAYEILVVVAIAFLLPFYKGSWSRDFGLPLIYTAIMAIGALTGILEGNRNVLILSEARGLLSIAAAFVWAVLMVRCGIQDQILRTLPIMLWISAAVVVLASTTGLPIRGRDATLVTAQGDLVEGATRITTVTQYLAFAALLAVVVLAVMGRPIPGMWLQIGLPALIITFLNFARYSVVSLAICALAAAIVKNRHTPLRRLSKVGMSVGVGAVAFVIVMQFGGPVGRQFSAYAERVIGGLFVDTSQDASLQWRFAENKHLWRAIDASPLLGHGLGYPYQPAYHWLRGDAAAYGQMYAHNTYLWLWTKTGMLGLAAFILFALIPIWKGLQSTNVAAQVSAIVSIAFLTTCVMAPIPEGTPDSIAIGLVLGACWAFAGSTQNLGTPPASTKTESPAQRWLVPARH